MRKLLKGLSFLLLLAPLFACSDSMNNPEYKKISGSLSPIGGQSVFFDIKDGFEFDPLSDKVRSFVNDYEPTSSLGIADKSDLYRPKSLRLGWSMSFSPLNQVFRLGLDKSFTNPLETELGGQVRQVYLNNLLADSTYFYNLEVNKGNEIIVSKTFSFKTASYPRCINVESISNTRDIGNGKIKQGRVYRGAKAEGISSAGIKTFQSLGIKADFDLRSPNEVSSVVGEVSPLGSDVKLLCFGSNDFGCPYYLGNDGINSTQKPYRIALAKALKAFGDTSNYPCFVHCAIGRDRTGTLLFLLEALCGYTEKEIYLDYEMSFLSSSGNADNASIKKMVEDTFTPLYLYIFDYDEGDLVYNTNKFMLDLGLSQEEIDNIKENLTK